MNVPRSGGGESEPISKVRHRVEQRGQLSHHPLALLHGHPHSAPLPDRAMQRQETRGGGCASRSLLNGRVSVVVVDPGERADSVFASKGCAQADSWV